MDLVPRFEVKSEHRVPLSQNVKRGPQAFLTKPEGTEWLVEPLIAHGYFSVMTAPEKTMKTMLAIELGLSIATGEAFMNKFPVPRAEPVFFLQVENRESMIDSRVRKILKSKGVEPEWRVEDTELGPTLTTDLTEGYDFMYATRPSFHFANQDELDDLDDFLSREKPRLLILDSLYRMASGLDLSDGRHMTYVLGIITYFQTRHNMAVMLIHNNKKAPSDPRSVQEPSDAMFGSSFLKNAYDDAFFLKRRRDEKHMIDVFHSSRHTDNKQFSFEVNIDDDDYAVKVYGESATGVGVNGKGQSETTEARVVDFIRRHPDPKSLKQAEVADQFGIGTRRFRQILQENDLVGIVGRRGRPPK